MAFFFTPPTVDQMVGRYPQGTLGFLGHRGIHNLWGRMANAPWGKNIYITQTDVVKEHGTIDEHNAAKFLYHGGRTHTITLEEKTILEAAGYTVVTT